jgi:hypothetical protein
VAHEPRVLFRCLASLALAVLASPLLCEGVERRDRGLAVERLRFNLLANSSLASRATTENVPVPQWLSVSGASNTTPIELTTSIPHGLETGDAVLVEGVEGNVAANGFWTITTIGERTFALDGSAGVDPYTGGGTAFPTAGQPPPPGPRGSAGHLVWTSWFSLPAAAKATEFFQPTGEVLTLPDTQTITSFLSQRIGASLLRPGQPLCLSIEARMSERAIGDQTFRVLVTAVLSTVRTYEATYSARALTTDYQRIALCFRLDDGPVPDDGVLIVEFLHEDSSGIPKAMLWRRPMLNEGTVAAPWTPEVQPGTRALAFR